MVAGLYFYNKMARKVPGAVRIPEVVALGSKLVCGAATTAQSGRSREVFDLLSDVRTPKTSQQPLLEPGAQPGPVWPLVFGVQSPPAVCVGFHSHPESLETRSFPLKSRFPF